MAEFSFVLDDYKDSHWYWEVVGKCKTNFLTLPVDAFPRCKLLLLCLSFADEAVATLPFTAVDCLSRAIQEADIVGLGRCGEKTRTFAADQLVF